MTKTTTATAAPTAMAASKDEDTVLFGSLPHTISDEFGDRIDAALAEGVSTLPLLRDAARSNRLLETLRKVYFRNVDVMESYMLRNIFTLQALPPTRRKKIVETYCMDKDQRDATLASSSKSVASAKVEAYEYPTAKEIPSAQQLTSLAEETKELRTKVRAARRRRNELLLQLERLAAADQAVKGAVSTTMSNQVPDGASVAAIVIGGKENLEQLGENGSELSRKLDEEKRERGDDDDELVQIKKPKLTLEQQYQEERNVIKTTDGLEKVKKLLKP